MEYKEVIAALRSAPSRSKRELFDTAADMIEAAMDKPVVTNADRIRAMSDEELAFFLDELYVHAWTCGATDDIDYCEWVGQPYKEGAEVASDVLMRPNGEEDA